jgi:hypothetical protein
MSKRKRNVDTVAHAQPKLREFPEWTVEQGMEVARMLYALEPFKINSEGAYFHWNRLAEEAFDFLDKSYKFCDELVRERSRWNAENRRREKEATEAATLPELVPFKKAMRFITSEKTTTRAIPKFQKFVRYNRRDFGEPSEQFLAILRRRRSLWWYGLTFRTLNGQIASSRETSVPRSLVLHLREMFKDSWKEIIAEENRAKANKRKKRGHRPDPKHKPLIRELMRAKHARSDDETTAK